MIPFVAILSCMIRSGITPKESWRFGTFPLGRHLSVGTKLGSNDARSGQPRRPIRTIVNVRSLRKLLVSALVAFHVMVMLCGPSLHGVPGIGHHVDVGAGAGERHDGHPVSGPHGLSDHCLVCQFFWQGQLPVAFVCNATSDQVMMLVPVERFYMTPHSSPTVSRPRAPPHRVTGIA